MHSPLIIFSPFVLHLHYKDWVFHEDLGGHEIGWVHVFPCRTNPPAHKQFPLTSGTAPVGQELIQLSPSLLYPDKHLKSEKSSFGIELIGQV